MNQRFYSLDVFRGATVALMILVNNPGSLEHIYAPLEHAPWHGLTPTDLVFPFFLFAVGNAMSFVMPRLEAAGTRAFLWKVTKRSLLIFGIGLFLNWFPFVKWSNDQLVWKYWVDPMNPENGIRILGVLQRIAICYFFASLIIYFFKIRGAYLISVILLLAYWVLCLLLGKPGNPYSMEGYFGNAIDKSVLGIAHMYKGEGVAFEPEGFMSSIPAIVQVIFGYIVGNYIRVYIVNLQNRPGKAVEIMQALYQMLTNLFVVGCIFIFAGYCWDMVFPINKKIWTSSYVLYTTGLAITILSVMIYFIECKGMRGAWSKFFDAFGKNPLFIFVLSGFLPRLLGLVRWPDHFSADGKPVYTSPLPWFYEHVCKPVSENLKIGSLIYAICLIIFYWSICYLLNKKKIYIRV